MKRWATVVGVLTVAATCLPAGVAEASSKASVVASFYPIRVGGTAGRRGAVAVTNLTPAGAEPHDLELDPDQIDDVLDAAVVFECHGFQPAVEQAAEQRERSDGAAAAGTHEGSTHLADPVRMAMIVRSVQRGLTKADPKGRAMYAANARRCARRAARARREVSQRARVLRAPRDRDRARGVRAPRRPVRAPTGGCGRTLTDAEPDAKRIAQLTDLVRRTGTTTVFTEEARVPADRGDARP